jgi:hypothetical protein
MKTDSKNNVYGQWSRTTDTDRYEKSYGIAPLYKQGTHPLYERLYK